MSAAFLTAIKAVGAAFQLQPQVKVRNQKSTPARATSHRDDLDCPVSEDSSFNQAETQPRQCPAPSTRNAGDRSRDFCRDVECLSAAQACTKSRSIQKVLSKAVPHVFRTTRGAGGQRFTLCILVQVLSLLGTGPMWLFDMGGRIWICGLDLLINGHSPRAGAILQRETTLNVPERQVIWQIFSGRGAIPYRRYAALVASPRAPLGFERVSRSGERPEPTVKVRMEENM